MLPAKIDELRPFERVSAFVDGHLLMQLGDVRSMMRLPLPELAIGHACNFASAATLCNIISGLSVTVFLPEPATEINKENEVQWVGSGAAFKALLGRYYPWGSGADPKEQSTVLYDLIRNPLAHALGVQGRSSVALDISRLTLPGQATGLTDAQLDEVESASTRPPWLPKTLERSRSTWSLSAEGLYRDVLHLLLSLVRDSEQMQMAEKRFSKGNVCWRNGKAKTAAIDLAP